MNGTNNKKMEKQLAKELKTKNGVSLKKKPKIRKNLYDRVFRAFIVEESSKVAQTKAKLKSQGFFIVGTSEPIGRFRKIWFARFAL